MANGTNKKENKTNEAEKSVPAGPAEQPKKKNGCLVAAIIAIAFLIVVGAFILIWLWPFIFSFLLDLRSGDFSLPKISETVRGTLKGKDLASLVDPSKTVTQRITAKNGGQITARTANGLYFTLNIGPGSLEKDTDISITPINESPIENYPDPSDPGVVIGPPGTNLGNGSSVNISGNPPSGGSGSQPGTGADGGTTTPPGTPPETPPDTPPGTPPTTPPDVSGSVPGLGALLGQLGNNTMPATPSGNPPGQGAAAGNTGANRGGRNTGNSSSNGSNTGSPRFTNTVLIIFTGYGGGVNPVPTEPSDDGDSISGPVDTTGGTSTDDPTPDEAQALADNARAASGGGACTSGYIEALARVVATASAAGDTTAVSRYESEIRRCNDGSLDHLKRLCENNPIQLRRKDFENRLSLARALPASSGTASEIERLMNGCSARYHFHAEGINPASAGDVTIFSSLDANVCGYLDDKWTGNQVYQLNAGDGSGHNFEGTAEFSLPQNAGSFLGISHGSNAFTVGGRSVSIPNFDFGFWGYFNGDSTIINLDLYPDTFISSTPIELQEKNCVPLAPLPR